MRGSSKVADTNEGVVWRVRNFEPDNVMLIIDIDDADRFNV